MRKPTFNLGPIREDIYKRWDSIAAFTRHLRSEYNDETITYQRLYHALLGNACTPSLARRVCEQLKLSVNRVRVKTK